MRRFYLLHVFVIVALLLLISCKIAFSQNERSLYFMPDIPQARFVNPAHDANHNLYVGIPALSSIRFGLENTFHYDDIFQRRGDSIYLDRDYLLSNLVEDNAINFDMMVEYISFGFRVKDNYFSFRIADVGNANASINRETIRFMVYGNGSEQFLGKDINLGGNAINFSYYREYALGFTRRVNERLTVGTNFKYLQGIANVFTNDFQFNLHTAPDDFTLTVKSNLDFNVSAPGIDDDAEVSDFIPNANNAGFAFDFGGQYQVNEQLSVSAGVVNIGAITWDSNVKNFRTADPDAEFVYDGFDISEFIQDRELNSERINQVLDSIADELGITETALKYTTPLPAWLNLNANYKLKESSQIGVLIRNRFLKDQNWTTVSLAYTHSFNNKVNLMVSNTFARGSYFTPGFGLSANLGPVQLYLVNENFTAPLLYRTARLYSIRFGINLVFREKVILPVEPAPQNGMYELPETNNGF